MALSFHSNSWESTQAQSERDMGMGMGMGMDMDKELLNLCFQDYYGFAANTDTNIPIPHMVCNNNHPLPLIEIEPPSDLLLDSCNCFNYYYSHEFNDLLPQFDSNYSLASEAVIPPPQLLEFEPYLGHPKRQKTCFEDYYPCYYSDHHGFFDDVPDPLLPDLGLVCFPNLPDFHFYDHSPPPPVYDSGCTVEAGTKQEPNNGNGGSSSSCLSAQSVAARQRRRKITDKTQELAKLIPGGHKLNTADMFHAASNYVKFLQAQLGILQLMPSIQSQNNEEPLHSGEFQALASSLRIQEKLCSSDKCLVPKQLLQTLATDPDLQSNSAILKELDQLIQTCGG